MFGRSASTSPRVNPQAASNANGNGSPHPKRAPASDDDRNLRLAVDKAIGQLSFIARSYEFDLVECNIDSLKADLVTMLRYRDLASIRFELIGGDSKVLFEFALNFESANGTGSRIIDTGDGVELPMFDRSLVTGKRLIIHRCGLESSYKDELTLPWSGAATIAKAAGAAYTSDHAAKISGGRQSASFHVADIARHRFVIIQTGTKGFGFAKDLSIDREGIFVLAKQLPAGVEFRIGAQFTGLLVQVPRGFQVRSVRLD
jgi:hypothetical protein